MAFLRRRDGIEVYRDPRDGACRSKTTVRRDASVWRAACPDVVRDTDAVLGPRM